MTDIIGAASKIDVQIWAAFLGALIATIGALLVSWIQRTADSERLKHDKIQAANLALLQSVKGVHRERVKAAEAELQCAVALLKAKFLNQDDPKGVDKKTSITTAADCKEEALYKRDRLDIHNDRAHEYELKCESYILELANLVPVYAEHAKKYRKLSKDMIASL